jgi:hypothetical protein
MHDIWIPARARVDTEQSKFHGTFLLIRLRSANILKFSLQVKKDSWKGGVICAITKSVHTEIFNTIGVKFGEMLDLQGFENFVWGSGDRVIRIAQDSYRTIEQLLGELEFLRDLPVRACRRARGIDG